MYDLSKKYLSFVYGNIIKKVYLCIQIYIYTLLYVIITNHITDLIINYYY